jgi:hypothetical protein
MNPITLATELLRRLPPRVRKTIYTVLAGVGALLGSLVAAGVKELGPLTVDQLVEWYAYLSPVLGVVAVANVTPGEGDEATLLDFDEDADASSFEPIGDESEVFADAVVH